jgi:hypothetical protein
MGCHSPNQAAKLKQFVDLLETGERNSRGTRVQRCTVRRQISKVRVEVTRSALNSVFFRRPVVRSGCAVHRPAVAPRPIPFTDAESLVAPASPSPTKDVFSIGDNNRNTNGGFVVTSFHGTRSHDRGTRAKWIQSLALHRLAAKARAVRCPSVAPVLGSYCRRQHRGRAAGTGEWVKGKGLP